MSPTEADGADGADHLVLEAPERPAWPPATWEMPLRKPVTSNEVTYDVLTLREPTEAEWQEIMAQEPKIRRRYAISRIAAVPMGAAEKIGIGDSVRAEAYLNAFFDVGQAIGGW